MPAIHLTAENFDKAISSGQLVFVDFWATWCRPCMMMGPIIDELADEYIGKTAVALTDFANGHGEVEFKGSKWEALSADEIRKGDTVVISSRESIKLTVEKK